MTSLPKGSAEMCNLIALSTAWGEVSIIKANDTVTTITLPLVEDLLTD